MKKVGIVSCYFKNNYGSLLQAYASQKVLDDNNIPNETIDISALKDFKNGKRKYYLTQLFNFGFIKTKLGMIKLKLDKKIKKELGNNIRIRDSKFNEFKKNFNLSKTCVDYKTLTSMADKKYSDVIVGSDQLWLPVNVVSDYYTLNWVSDSVNKISYATSFGVSNIPKKYNEQYTKFLKRINHLSVREESGVSLIKELTDLDAKLVCDPTLLLSKEEWDEVATKERFIQDKYIFCYFLGNNIEHRKFAERLREKTGYKIVSINHSDEYVKYSDIFADIIPYNVGPSEWINLIKNAEYVCTDSFHGTVFSLLYNKVFFDFRRHSQKNKNSTNSRLDSLLNVANVNKERILTGLENVEDVLKFELDFKIINKNLEKFRNDSKNWLFNSITWEKEDEEKYIEIKDKDLCSGCTACKSICPKDAIEMVADEEGFLYPKVNKEKCIKCGLCKKTCPILNRVKEVESEQRGYIINNKDEIIRKQSTSGGFFTAIAEFVIEKGGKVYGAGFSEDFIVKHCAALDKDSLIKFRNSKYVQSDLGETFSQVKKDLEKGLMVCYSGTPCQIEGLNKFLGKKYKNLILVDVVCRAVPSPKLLNIYLKYIKENRLCNEEIRKVVFRDKSKYGYKYTLMTVQSENYTYQEGIDTDPYLRAFFSGLAIRPSCENCSFKKRYRVSDFTMWDCFEVENYDKKFDDNLGTTRVIIQSEKGKEIFELIKDKIFSKEVELNKLLVGSHELTHSTKNNPLRSTFFEDFNQMEYQDLNSKYLKNKLFNRMERFIRRILVNTGVYKKVKRFAKKILKR